MRDAAAKLAARIGSDYEAWASDEDLRLITERLVEIIGEAVRAMTNERRSQARDPKSRTGEAIRVVGYSAGMDRVWSFCWCQIAIPRTGGGTSPPRGRQMVALVGLTARKGTRMADKELLDRITAAVEDAEATSDDELKWARHQEPAKNPAAVYSVRIPVDRIEELRQLAADRGVQPTALIRTWVLAQLDAARSSDDYAQRCERDVRAAADQLRNLLDKRPGASWADAS